MPQPTHAEWTLAITELESTATMRRLARGDDEPRAAVLQRFADYLRTIKPPAPELRPVSEWRGLNLGQCKCGAQLERFTGPNASGVLCRWCDADEVAALLELNADTDTDGNEFDDDDDDDETDADAADVCSVCYSEHVSTADDQRCAEWRAEADEDAELDASLYGVGEK
jgi:hypothetical protein